MQSTGQQSQKRHPRWPQSKQAPAQAPLPWQWTTLKLQLCRIEAGEQTEAAGAAAAAVEVLQGAPEGAQVRTKAKLETTTRTAHHQMVAVTPTNASESQPTFARDHFHAHGGHLLEPRQMNEELAALKFRLQTLVTKLKV